MSLTQQKSDLEKLKAAIAAGNGKIAAIDPGLRPEVRAQRIVVIRADTIKTLDAINGEMAKRQTVAREGLDFWTQEAVRRRAKFAADPAVDAAQRVAMFEVLKRSSTAEIVQHMKDAVREKSAARAEVCRLEFKNRTDRDAALSREFDRLLERVDDKQAADMHAECGQTDGLADFAQVLVREFRSGVSRPEERITAARAAGLVAPPPAPIDPAERVAGLRVAGLAA
jgi:hypothetical protein